MLIGREAELTLLEEGIEAARAGRGASFLLLGEPGAGKTRLAAAAAEAGARRGLQPHWGRSHGGATLPLWPWRQLVRSLLASPGGLPAGAIDAMIPIRTWLAATPHTGAGAQQSFARAPSDQVRTFSAIAETVELTSEDRPLLLVLEDLHWADQTSVMAWQFVARHLDSSRVMMIATSRPEPTQPIVAPPSCAVVELRGLSAREVHQWIERSNVGDEPVHVSALARSLHAATGGNPLRLEQLLVVVERQAELDLGSTGAGLDANTADDWVSLRIARLPAAVQRILEVGSLLGDELDVSELAEATENDPSQLTVWLEEATRAGALARLDESPGWRFTHAVWRESLATRMSEADRSEAHLAIGRMLLARVPWDPDVRVARLAYHFIEAGPTGEPAHAFRYCMEAAQFAVSEHSYELAVDLLRSAERASSWLPDSDDRALQVTMATGEALALRGEFERARDRFGAAIGIARRSGASAALARAALGFAGDHLRVFSADPEAARLLDEALAALPESERALRARVAARLVLELVTLPGDGSHSRAAMLVEQAMADARATGDPAAVAQVLLVKRVIDESPDATGQRLAEAKSLVEAGEQAGLVDLRLQGLRWLAAERIQRGDVVGCRSALDAQHAIQDRHRQFDRRYQRAMWSAMFAVLEGRFDEAEEEIRIARSRVSPHGFLPAHLIEPAAIECVLADLRGSLAAIAPAAETVLAGFAAYPIMACWSAWLAARAGNLEVAAVRLSRFASSSFRELPGGFVRVLSAALVAEAAIATRNEGAAERLYELLAPHRDRSIVMGNAVVLLDTTERVMGRLAGVLGRAREAESHLRNALARFAKLRADPWVALTQADLVDAITKDPGRRGEAATLEREARAAASRLGMVGLVTRLGVEQPEPAPAPRQPRIGPSSIDASLERDRAGWRLEFDGRAISIPAMLGASVLASLLARPNVEVHCLMLSREIGGAEAREAPSTERPGMDAEWPGRDRLAALERELDVAEATGNEPLAAVIRETMQELVSLDSVEEQIPQPRAERARVNVRRVLSATIKRIERDHPGAGLYLSSTVQTGTYCRYTPDPRFRVRWKIRAEP